MNISDSSRKTISWSIRGVLAFLFLLSAVAKLYPSPHFALTTFEVKQLLPMGFSEFWASHFSRTLIGCEFALGFGLLQPHFFKRLVLPLSFLILFVFSVQLSYEIATTGNEGNCGCFGSLMPMSPLQALIKNILAMGLIGFLYKLTDKNNDKMNFPIITSIAFGSILAVYMVGPISKSSKVVPMSSIEVVEDEDSDNDTSVVVNSNPQVKGSDTASVVTPIKIDEPKKKKSGYAKFFPDIDKGKKILCFFAPGCDHCQAAAVELTQMKKQNPDFPEIRILFMDEEAELIPEFLSKAGAKYSYQILDVASFWGAIGGTRDTPGVFYFWNGNQIKAYDGINDNKFKAAEFKALVKKEWKELK
jgi:thiol-disulfide isomerase/thioredoxin